MRIKQISVKGLFGTFDHVIPLNLEDNITIIHGPNGFGKTILLEILNEVFNNPNPVFRHKFPLTEFKVDFEENEEDKTPPLLLTQAENKSGDLYISRCSSQTLKKAVPVSLIKTERLPAVSNFTMLSQSPELDRKIALFKDIINGHFLYKQMTFSKELGFVFTNSLGDSLALSDLSLGEQYEIVLFYKLLFETQPNTLILLDEPEHSLHVMWETYFLGDLEKIMQFVSFEVLMATHSPGIISDRWDLTVELKRPKT